MSFSQLFQDLGKFVKDPNTRWDYCVRAKRGWTDTSQPGGFLLCLLYCCTSGRFSSCHTLKPFQNRAMGLRTCWNEAAGFRLLKTRLKMHLHEAFRPNAVMDGFCSWKWECKLRNTEGVHTVWPPFMFITRDVMLLWVFTGTIFCVWFLSLASGFSLLLRFWEGFQSLGYKHLLFKNTVVLLGIAPGNMPWANPDRVYLLLPFRLFQ